MEAADEGLRNNLWNVIALHYLPDAYYWVEDNGDVKSFLQLLHHSFLRRPIDEIKDDLPQERQKLKNIIRTCKWFHLYDLIEFAAQPEAARHLPRSTRDQLIADINGVLEVNGAGYRLIDGIVTPITDKAELDAIDDALAVPDGYAVAREHIRTALELYSDRASPDYRNAIKEAISAVEAVARDHSSKTKTGAAIKDLGQVYDLHPALAGALNQLYGYTSDGDGIRHAMKTGIGVDPALAKFMIVVCSAFVSYAVEKISAK
ncbi:hypothetical protein AUC68_02935 [Methyloceanibacter methanicus]|uniref:HEPN AbiJ-N-terminal domain-containing protein n=1 Tax=Methyloceanibacter methanicus TaxID=1774968 RepID=A0A1E3W2X1_9HYPH|nr:hypothetical protein AUC68_02935 [Methyloceanibacter methanicus]